MCDYWCPWRSYELRDFVKEIWNLDIFDWEPKKKGYVFLVNVFSSTISSQTFFHICDIYNFIYVVKIVWKTFKELLCQMCGKWFTKKEIAKKHAKNTGIFLFPVKHIKIPDIFYKIQQFLNMSWTSLIAHKDLLL